MRLGLSVYDIGATELCELAVAAEAAGFETLWLGEHLLMPAGYEAVHPTREPDGEGSARIVGRDTELLDPLVALGAAAVVTRHLQLATGIYVVPLRHPLAVARQCLTVQELAGGRFLFGAGAGWLQEEFDALAVPFEERARRFDESLDVLRAAWRGGVFEHHGEVYDFGPVQLAPVEAKIPLVVGGNTAPAMRRAARTADGWFASANPSYTEAVGLLSALDRASEEVGRSDRLATYVRASPAAGVDIDAYERAGVDQLIVWAHELCPPGPDRWAGLAGAAAEHLGARRPSVPATIAGPVGAGEAHP